MNELTNNETEEQPEETDEQPEESCNNQHNNIFFSLEEIEPTHSETEYNIQTILDELDDLYVTEETQFSYLDSEICKTHRVFYQQNTVKELLKICQYYGIDKHMKIAKFKKSDMIDAILYYESDPQHFESVGKRYKMWEYMEELVNDPNMRKYVIWN